MKYNIIQKGGILRKDKGFSILDILIFVLIIAVLVALIIPKMKKDEKAANQSIAREKMTVISDAQEQYFRTAAGRIDPDKVEEPDTLAEGEEATEEADSIVIIRLYTDDFEDLKDFLPEDFEPTSPPNGRQFKLFAKDSSYFAIYDPNGHGTILNSKKLWEDN